MKPARKIPALRTLDYWRHKELFVFHAQLESVSDPDGTVHVYLKKWMKYDQTEFVRICSFVYPNHRLPTHKAEERYIVK